MTRVFALALVLALLCACRPAAAQSYTAILLPLPSGSGASQAEDINDRGRIVGYMYTSPGGSLHAALWESRTTLPRDLGEGQAHGINERGQVVGEYRTASGDIRACLWQNGTRFDLYAPNALQFGLARDINDQGQIVISGSGAAGDTHAFIWTPSTPNGTSGTMRDLGRGNPMAINNREQVAGGDGFFAILWENNTSRKFDPLPHGDNSLPRDINEQGKFVGFCSINGSPGFHGVLWQSGTAPIPLEASGVPASLATGINDDGLVVGMLRSPATGIFLWENGEGHNLGLLGLSGVAATGRINTGGDFVGAAADLSGRNLKAFVAHVSGGITGKVEYEKVPVTAEGLDLSGKVRRPAVSIRVEAVAVPSGDVIGTGLTDASGNYSISVSRSGRMKVRALARLEVPVGTAEVLGAPDTPDADTLYSITGEVFKLQPGGSRTKNLLARDHNRASGPFNILEVIRQIDARVATLEFGLELPPLTVRWSTRYIAGTFFRRDNNTAFINGRRNKDSDEFDDTVIAHEYGHYMLRAISRTDSPGGDHPAGDRLHPGQAWSEGAATYFGCAFLAAPTPDYRDSLGHQGKDLFSSNLETNVPAGDDPGYWSEASVSGLLWDLTDTPADAGDTSRLDYAAIWKAWKALKNHTYVYLIDFCEALSGGTPGTGTDLQALLATRSVPDYTSGADPPVPAPFPSLIASGVPVSGALDSLTRTRKNLVSSSHFFELRLTSAGTIRALLKIDSGAIAPADLDLYLLDRSGVEIGSSKAVNGPGDTEEILTPLSPGYYVIEVRSYSQSGETVTFNKAGYSLTVTYP